MISHMMAIIFTKTMEVYVIILARKLGAIFKLEALINACQLTVNHA